MARIVIDIGVLPHVVVQLDCPDEEVDTLVARYCVMNQRDLTQIVVGKRVGAEATDFKRRT